MNIHIENVSMQYSTGKKALSRICLNLEGPGMTGLLGPNGAGKSTLMKILTTQLVPTQGEVFVDGKPCLMQEREYKERLGYLPQAFGLFDELTTRQFLEYMAILKDVRDVDSVVESAILQTNLEAKRKSRIGTLSGGQRQRVGIAQAILGTPALLILDEPTVGLDPEERISFRNMFSQLADNALVLLSTHIIEDVQSVCNRLIILDEGHIRFAGTPAQLLTEAAGHVGMFVDTGRSPHPDLRITSRIHTADGFLCRIVAKDLPLFAQEVEPTLEDAYLYRLSEEVV